MPGTITDTTRARYETAGIDAENMCPPAAYTCEAGGPHCNISLRYVRRATMPAAWRAYSIALAHA